MLIGVEHEKSFITSGPYFVIEQKFLFLGSCPKVSVGIIVTTE